MKLTPTQRKNLIPLVLFLANLVFLYIGGLIFKSIEYEPREKLTTSDDVALFLQTLKKTSLGEQILPKDFNIEVAAKGLNSESLKKLDAKFDSIRNERTAASLPGWSFSNSLFFATTVVTTIGNYFFLLSGVISFCAKADSLAASSVKKEKKIQYNYLDSFQ